MLTKTQQFLFYLLKIHKHCSVIFLLHLAYLIDCLCFDTTKKQISSFRYKRYSFGPFDQNILMSLENLITAGMLKSHINYTRTGRECVTYAFNDRHLADDLIFQELNMPYITTKEFLLIKAFVLKLLDYTERELTDMVYKTKPMKALGATQSGLEGIGKRLKFTPLFLP